MDNVFYFFTVVRFSDAGYMYVILLYRIRDITKDMIIVHRWRKMYRSAMYNYRVRPYWIQCSSG